MMLAVNSNDSPRKTNLPIDNTGNMIYDNNIHTSNAIYHLEKQMT